MKNAKDSGLEYRLAGAFDGAVATYVIMAATFWLLWFFGAISQSAAAEVMISGGVMLLVICGFGIAVSCSQR